MKPNRAIYALKWTKRIFRRRKGLRSKYRKVSGTLYEVSQRRGMFCFRPLISNPTAQISSMGTRRRPAGRGDSGTVVAMGAALDSPEFMDFATPSSRKGTESTGRRRISPRIHLATLFAPRKSKKCSPRWRTRAAFGEIRTSAFVAARARFAAETESKRAGYDA